MAKFSVGGEGEGASSSSCHRKRRRADSAAEEGFDETSFFEDEEETATKISITIDPDVLDCSICLEPLIPPVFQCDNGHIACSSCCTKLKNKCHSCSLAIYARCLAIEKVVESIKTSCRNARYGCKEEVGYTHRTSHEETCIYSPCSCPISGCTFLGSSEQLSLHFSSMHWASATRFRYNCPFLVSFDKSEPFIILQSEDGHLFLLYNSKETIGNAISVTSIGPRSPVGGFSYDLITRDGGRTLRLQSFTKSLLRRMETSPSIDFLLVPNGFHSCSEQPKMEVGIDAYSWLHKGAYSCSMNLCLYPGSEKASRYLEYFMHRINLLRHYNVTPVVVFDGGDIPCKSATSNERQRRREANLSLAKENLEQGNVNAAHDYFQKSVCITPSVAYPLIQILRSEGVDFIVAPYEADAQLAYLSTLEEEQGGISAVITEDSDLMAYNCPAVIFKMDRYGKGEEILLDKVFTSVLCGLSFRHFDKKLFTGMCVLAGCDFLPSVPGIGIKRAYTYVSKYRNLDRVLSMLKYDKSSQMPEDYFKSFREAITVFHHARIYDPDTKSLKPMKPLPMELIQSLENDLDFLGPEVPPSIASAIAEGRIDPITMETFDYFPATKFHCDRVKTDASDHPPRPKVQMVLKQQSCFTIFAAQKTEHEKITDSLHRRMYSTEAAAFEKLIAPPKLPRKEVIEVDRRKIPDNNPFKKRKTNELNLERKLSTSKQVSGVTNISELDDTACATPDSQKSVGSKPAKNAKY